MTERKLREIFQYNLSSGKYVAVGKPAIIDIVEESSPEIKRKNEEAIEEEFIGSLEKAIGTARFSDVHIEPEFFLRGLTHYYGAVLGQNEKGEDCDVFIRYIPVQLYKTAKFDVKIS